MCMHIISGDLGLVHPKLNALNLDYFSVADKDLKSEDSYLRILRPTS